MKPNIHQAFYVNQIQNDKEYLNDESGNTNRYSGLCHMVQKLVNILKQMDQKDPFRIDMTDKLLEKLHRLSTVLVRLKFAEHSKEAVTYIEQGHIRVGPETVTDPAFLIQHQNKSSLVSTPKSRKPQKSENINVLSTH
ncbi:hypothetical protein JHK87_044339 [Glycine soja]|nr:hypothetical protein JHK87_044339 [Glycine soja]